MPAKMVSLRLTPELLERIDAAAGEESRTAWMVRALESALGRDEGSGVSTSKPDGRRAELSAQSRAPGPIRVDTVAQTRSLLAARQAKLNAAKEKAS